MIASSSHQLVVKLMPREEGVIYIEKDRERGKDREEERERERVSERERVAQGCDGLFLSADRKRCGSRLAV